MDRTDFCEKVGGEKVLRWFVGPDRWLVGLEQGCLGEVIVGGGLRF